MRKKRNGEWFKEPGEHAEVQIKCPKCYAVTTNEAVVCMLCGYNRSTGKYVELPQKRAATPKKKKWRALSFILNTSTVLLFLLVLVGYVYYEPIREENKNRLSDTLKEKLPMQLSRPFNPEWLHKLTKDALVSVYESDLSEALAVSHPPYAVGDTVVLQSDIIKPRRGIFQGLEERDALLKIGEQIIRFPFLSLTHDCRLRADWTGRQVYIRETASQRAEALLKQ